MKKILILCLFLFGCESDEEKLVKRVEQHNHDHAMYKKMLQSKSQVIRELSIREEPYTQEQDPFYGIDTLYGEDKSWFKDKKSGKYMFYRNPEDKDGLWLYKKNPDYEGDK